MIVYDITERGSFHSVVRWMNELSSLGEPPAAATVLVGNKSDLGHLRAVSTDEARAFAGI